MKIIYVGGYSDRNDSHFTKLAPAIKNFVESGKKIVFVNLASEPGHHDSILTHIYGTLPETIDDNSDTKVDWGVYDLIYFTGGRTNRLKSLLPKYEFNTSKLKKDVVLIGDSAGANILAKFYISTDPNNRKYALEEGFVPESNILILPHVDNSTKTSLEKLGTAKKLATDHDAKLLLLNENQYFVFDEKKLRPYVVGDSLTD